MGGRIAEELVFKDFTTGASNDLEHAHNIARKMVMNFGMSEDMPYQVFTEGDSSSVFLGRKFAEGPHYSDETAAKIDNSIKELMLEAAQRAKKVIQTNREKLDLIAKRLIEVETLEREEFVALMK
jgi:cell division protease FtsH